MTIFLITTFKYFDQINGSRTAKVTVSEEEPRKATNKGEAGGQQGGGKGGTTLHVLYLQGISTLCSSYSRLPYLFCNSIVYLCRRRCPISSRMASTGKANILSSHCPPNLRRPTAKTMTSNCRPKMTEQNALCTGVSFAGSLCSFHTSTVSLNLQYNTFYSLHWLPTRFIATKLA